MEDPKQPAPRRRQYRRKGSAVSSGRKFFIEGDGKSPWARRMRDIATDLANDLGGPDTLSQQQLSLIRRAATISVELELMESRGSVGEILDLDRYGRAAGNLRRIFECLGLERKAKNVTNLDLQTYIATTYQKDEK
jgi:hypothetical protein